jgi:hypothetical protein
VEGAAAVQEKREGLFFSFCPFPFLIIIDGRMEGAGRSVHKMGWALLMGLSSKFRSTNFLFLTLFKII